jgi:hypothetical protein
VFPYASGGAVPLAAAVYGAARLHISLTRPVSHYYRDSIARATYRTACIPYKWLLQFFVNISEEQLAWAGLLGGAVRLETVSTNENEPNGEVDSNAKPIICKRVNTKMLKNICSSYFLEINCTVH